MSTPPLFYLLKQMMITKHLFLLVALIPNVGFGQSTNLQIQNGNAQLSTILYPKPKAETVILLHGGPGVPDSIEQVASQLNAKYQVIYFEQRNTGNSKCTDCSYTMNDYISDIDSIAHYFHLDDFHLFGHSWGGLYAQIYAEQQPSRVKSLFLCSPSSGTNETWKETEKEVLQFNKNNTSTGEWLKMGWQSLLGKLGNDKAYQKLFKQVYKNYHKGFLEPSDNEKELTGIHSEPINKTRKEIIDFPPLKIMKDSLFPICITYGEKDIYGESRNHVIERYPSAKVFEIENSGHIPWLHTPAEFSAILNEFYGM